MSTSPPPPPPALTRSSLLLRRFIYNSLFEESRISNILFFAEKRLVYYTSIYRGTYALFFWLKKKRVLNSGLLNPFGTWFILITVKRHPPPPPTILRRFQASSSSVSSMGGAFPPEDPSRGFLGRLYCSTNCKSWGCRFGLPWQSASVVGRREPVLGLVGGKDVMRGTLRVSILTFFVLDGVLCVRPQRLAVSLVLLWRAYPLLYMSLPLVLRPQMLARGSKRLDHAACARPVRVFEMLASSFGHQFYHRQLCRGRCHNFSFRFSSFFFITLRSQRGYKVKKKVAQIEKITI